MKRLFVVAFVLLSSTLISVPIMVHGQATPGFSYSWRGATYRGNDSFYDPTMSTYVYAYEENTKAILSITVWANSTQQLNVSSVRVSFDWANGIYNGSYADEVISAANLLLIPKAASRPVGISFTVPSTSIAPDINLYLHSYTIIVEHLNATSTPTETTQITNFASDFAIYSADQADSRDLYDRVQTVKVPTAKFNSSKAKMLVYKAENETSTGDVAYTHGDFAGAKAHYNAALVLYNSAYTAEETFSVTDEDVTLNLRSLTVNRTRVEIQLLEAQIKNIESWASMVFSTGITLTLFGVTTMLFGIGYIIKQLAALKKTGQQATTE
ncbi:MAG: hypothetical protein JSV12_04385 [Candidatus Bathyarchaeota archaeon]|nr:MAG: hypothetical protein JSV12_04385 [Candidatus Bathyarchaeota archaeon]